MPKNPWQLTGEAWSNRMMMVTFEIPEAELPAMREAARKFLEDLS